jgi:hypothetical protein
MRLVGYYENSSATKIKGGTLRNFMNIQFISDKAKGINDVINVHRYMAQIMKYARSRSAKNCEACTLPGRCATCHQVARTQAHHIRPVWTFALEYILDSGAQTDKDFSNAVQKIQTDQIDQWNQLSNLVPLCSRCHKATQKSTDEKWKRYFEANYPIIFGLRNLKEVLRRLNL